jgi:hypothetical protein
VTNTPIEFVLAGCHAGHPLDDLPALPGDWCWFVDRWTGPMPSAAELADKLGAPVLDWPLSFDEQMSCALTAPCVLLVRGDPLVATPHRHLVDALKSAGKRVMVRRRIGIAELAAEFAPAKPRVLPGSAEAKIAEHLSEQKGPLLVVSDSDESDLSRYLDERWKHLWLSHLGGEKIFVGRHQPRSELLSLLFIERSD